MKKLRLFSEFMTSQIGKQVIKIHILPNISRSKDNQTMNLTWEMFFWINHLATHQVICIRYFLYILIMLNLTFLKCFLKTFQTFLKSFKTLCSWLRDNFSFALCTLNNDFEDSPFIAQKRYFCPKKHRQPKLRALQLHFLT